MRYGESVDFVGGGGCNIEPLVDGIGLHGICDVDVGPDVAKRVDDVDGRVIVAPFVVSQSVACCLS